ncbi:hypothetical protein ACJDU8_17600 [Clostridium sp. WILCCON 0269]|uniref:Uncharacterized protein n=1 Tax=Candidatus Clostridium eludens TaxID=3381663 RepID=A0ABW8SQ96_9CLOT
MGNVNSSAQQPVTPIQQTPVTPPSAPIQPVQPVTQPQPTQQQMPPVANTAVPTAIQTYTMDQLALAATQLMDAGKQVQLQQLLASFGVQALTFLPKEQYGAFATQLRAMGAQI